MIIFLSVYLLLQLLIGIYVSYKVKSSTDFFLAGRKMPTAVVTLSLMATWFGAETCIGSSAMVYKSGLSGSRADPFGYSICLLFLGIFLAAPLWKKGCVTLSDLFAGAFGASTEKISALILIPGSLIWAAAQIRAFGQIVGSMTDLPVNEVLILCTLFIFIYTFLGGLLGDIVTDVIQGVLIFVGLCTLVYFVIEAPEFQWSLLSEQSSQRWSLFAANESWWQRIERWAIPIFGSLTAQELIARTLSSKSPQVARRASFQAAGLYLFMGLLPVFLGLIGPNLITPTGDVEQFLPQLAQLYMPAFFYVLFMGALVSAMLSTIDSIFLSTSALVTQNFIVHLTPNMTDKHKLRWARLTVALSALSSYVIARFSSGIYDLLESASSFGTAGVLVVTLFALWSRWGGPFAAGLCLLGGILIYPLGEYILKIQAPFVITLISCLVIYVTVGLFEQKREALFH